MSVMLQNPDLPDPLRDYSVLSYLPRTFQRSNRTDNFTHGDLQPVFELLEVKSSKDLSEQAKTILNSTELPKSDILEGVLSADVDRDMPPRIDFRPQERRPDLGRKRARFSLKPNASQTSLGGGMSLNIEKFQDPEELFSAYEDIERAEKELRKQRGEFSLDLTQHVPSTKLRSPRPGLMGRKAGYKNRFSSIIAELEQTLHSSEKIPEVDIASPSNSVLNLSNAVTHGVKQKSEFTGGGRVTTQDSVTEGKNKADDLLDEILSEDCTDLDGDGAIKFLQECLHIRPINVDRLYFPKVDSVHRGGDEVSTEQLPIPVQALSNIQHPRKRVKGKGSVEIHQLTIRSSYSEDSTTPPRSPFSPKPILLRQVSVADQPISMTDDSAPSLNFTNDTNLGLNGRDGGLQDNVEDTQQPENVGSGMNSANIDMVLDKMVADITSQALDPMKDKSGQSSDNMSLSLSERDVELEDNCEGTMPSEMVDKEKNPADSNVTIDKLVTDDSAHSLESIEDNPRESSNQMNLSLNECDGLEDKVEEMQQPTADEENSAVNNIVSEERVTDNSAHSLDPKEDSLPKFGNHVSYESNGRDNGLEDSQLETLGSKQVDLSSVGLTTGNLHGSADMSYPVIDEDHPRDGQSENVDIFPEQNNEVQKEHCRGTLNVQSKRKASTRKGRRKKVSHSKRLAGESLNVQSRQKTTRPFLRGRLEVSRRKSLDGAGTQWQDGKRRSTRIKMRPLEYWRGERFLYGRVHDSLLTVIGCKCASPTKDSERPELKVLSFVSDNYKDLVEKVCV